MESQGQQTGNRFLEQLERRKIYKIGSFMDVHITFHWQELQLVRYGLLCAAREQHACLPHPNTFRDSCFLNVQRECDLVVVLDGDDGVPSQDHNS